MSRWIVLLALLLVVVASAITVVALKHQGRQHFIALETLNKQKDAYQVEWSRLQLELAWLGETGRIERQARENLNMKSPQRIGVLVTRDD
ncbi:MAG: cell division protein FtsL [Xanthomonadaceae bacterium]|nr:cell division protein FtsL [Xanthomonadaceae bacterium]